MENTFNVKFANIVYFLYLQITIRNHHRHNFVTAIDPRLTRALPIRDVRPTLFILITMRDKRSWLPYVAANFFTPQRGKKPIAQGNAL
jgi:hypothetical protein